MITKIISGGQTGADRGGLDAAIALGINTPANAPWGWCPLGRRAEDGVIPAGYQLIETDQRGYRFRTEYNVRESDATVIFSLDGGLGAGSRLTFTFAGMWDRRCLVVNLARPWEFERRKFAAFLPQREGGILNVAGSRESKAPGIQAEVATFLIEALRDQRSEARP